ncbi:MAG: hypothetical protein A3A80_01680 [Candidatus Terrybacteria bacterium RIFCSPLOWO2_01_FULL_44_24]|uniref:tRNA/rRNA methyltransferase SpoU type domain-containing protein n=1 Tax=Candidatus Terrybacteria bacterium RIFCSPHIGHO2_01_FULL_43_35 TaxID=1802361 RepID=A0A1G2PHM1_9BACT|nr:MAG: hypothetical protein A2828_04060 [Candidatus Terrybacteria bacterium RIFCSPHIGHO2_01_FULL_43_35]OHA49894.1 MAG: hypothetical protein A3B75_03245 [Candidatus Terrybacteria bacterium RIFCSPHIGHO2_02_FULL_43_14]OHA51785.1 MAG: hypothetical protein A3A80_01680 [Candidatus Terrybacteria bacterium RIFCSPLOWO2_01_FULL_44_24]
MIAVLHNVRSVYNVGSIFRTADAAGIEKIYLCGYTPAPLDRFKRSNIKLSKVALGAEEYLPWQKIFSTTKLLAKLREEGYLIFAVEQSKGSIPYFKLRKADLSAKMVMVVGNELKGLPQAVLKQADKIIEIPMYGKKESLNVSVALGIVAFHMANLSRIK